MDRRPLLFVSARPEVDAADVEYAAFCAATGLAPHELHRHDLVGTPLPAGALDEYRGFVGGGSPFNVGDDETSKSAVQRRVEADLERIAQAAASGRTRAVLTCYGIGIVTRMLGGRISRELSEATGETGVSLTPDSAGDALFGELPARFAAYTAHKEGAATLPAGAVLLASSDRCPVQAYRVGDRLWTTQFHPELTAESFVARIAVYRSHGYFAPDDYDRVLARVRAAEVQEPPRILRAFASL